MPDGLEFSCPAPRDSHPCFYGNLATKTSHWMSGEFGLCQYTPMLPLHSRPPGRRAAAGGGRQPGWIPMTGLLHKARRWLFGYDAADSGNKRQPPTGRLRSEDKEFLPHPAPPRASALWQTNDHVGEKRSLIHLPPTFWSTSQAFRVPAPRAGSRRRHRAKEQRRGAARPPPRCSRQGACLLPRGRRAADHLPRTCR